MCLCLSILFQDTAYTMFHLGFCAVLGFSNVCIKHFESLPQGAKRPRELYIASQSDDNIDLLAWLFLKNFIQDKKKEKYSWKGSIGLTIQNKNCYLYGKSQWLNRIHISSIWNPAWPLLVFCLPDCECSQIYDIFRKLSCYPSWCLIILFMAQPWWK